VAELIDHPGPTAGPAVTTPTAEAPAATVEPDPAGQSTAPAATAPAGKPFVPVEIRLLAAVQQRVGGRAVGVARGMSLFGEHAAGWIALGLVGAAVNRSHRREWLTAAAGVTLAHGASIGVKRVVRRTRPDHPSVEVRVGTPSRLSFPSAHATSTTAAAVLYGRLLRRPLVPVLVPPMALSRLVLGVHYPSDVVAGSALGAVVALAVRRVGRRRPIPQGR
jgi:membrane-associated phospholipid phosphatase